MVATKTIQLDLVVMPQQASVSVCLELLEKNVTTVHIVGFSRIMKDALNVMLALMGSLM